MQRFVIRWSMRLVVFSLSNISLAETKRVLIENSQSYLKAEFLTDHLIHFELSAKKPAPPLDQPIFTTPMVARKTYPGPNNFSQQGQHYQSKDLGIHVNQATMCVQMTDLRGGYELGTICPQNLNQPWKGLTIDAPSFKDILGLGQSFPQPQEQNPSWLGRMNIPGKFGNELRGYDGGAVGYTQIPVLYALGKDQQNFAMFFDHPYKQQWDFKDNPWSMQTWGDQIRWYVFSGRGIDDLRKAYMDLTGRPPLPAKKIFGFWLSEFGYESWDEILTHKQTLQTNKFPIDGFALDLQWYGGNFGDPDHSRMGTLTWDPTHFFDATQHIKSLATEGISVMTIEQPYVAKNLREHEDLSKRGFFARDCETCGSTFIDHNPWWGRGGIIDFTNPEAGRYWHRTKRRPLIAQGIYAHWCDLGEPEMYKDWSWYYGVEGADLHQHGDIHNLFNLMWAKSIADGYAEDHINQRPLLLSRSGAAGIQRHSNALWSGDIAANLNSMVAHHRAQHHLGLSGIDYYGSDIGGFYRPAGDGHEAMLYSMWLANSLITDMPARSHMWNLTHEYINNPASIGDVSSNLNNLRLRYQLLPYYYSLSQHAAESGDPIIAPLLYYWQGDAPLRQTDLQKMVGPYLMASLLTNYEGIATVKVPKGQWYDFHTLAPLQKGIQQQHVVLDRSRITVPLYIREGAIIPMYGNPERIRNVDDTAEQPLFFLIAPSSTESSFFYYDDDGTTTSGGAKTGLFVKQQPTETGGVQITARPRFAVDHAKLARSLTLTLLKTAKTVSRVAWNNHALPRCRKDETACWASSDKTYTVNLEPSDFFAGGNLTLE